MKSTNIVRFKILSLISAISLAGCSEQLNVCVSGNFNSHLVFSIIENDERIPVVVHQLEITAVVDASLKQDFWVITGESLVNEIDYGVLPPGMKELTKSDKLNLASSYEIFVKLVRENEGRRIFAKEVFSFDKFGDVSVENNKCP